VSKGERRIVTQSLKEGWGDYVQVGYFLSPLDFLNELLIFFLFRAAFKRLVLLRLFIFPPPKSRVDSGK